MRSGFDSPTAHSFCHLSHCFDTIRPLAHHLTPPHLHLFSTATTLNSHADTNANVTTLLPLPPASLTTTTVGPSISPLIWASLLELFVGQSPTCVHAAYGLLVRLAACRCSSLRSECWFEWHFPSLRIVDCRYPVFTSVHCVVWRCVCCSCFCFAAGARASSICVHLLLFHGWFACIGFGCSFVCLFAGLSACLLPLFARSFFFFLRVDSSSFLLVSVVVLCSNCLLPVACCPFLIPCVGTL